MHEIDEQSPLYGRTLEDIQKERGEIIAVLDGTDGNTSEAYQAKWSYCAEEILVNEEFVECLHYSKPNMHEVLTCDLDEISKTQQIVFEN